MQAFPWQTLIRAILKIYSGWLCARGWNIDDSTAEIVSGVAVALVSTAWGYWEKRHLQKKIRQLQEQCDTMPQI